MTANDTQLVFGQTMQFIQGDTPFPHEITEDQEQHGVLEFVLGVDLLPTPSQMVFNPHSSSGCLIRSAICFASRIAASNSRWRAWSNARRAIAFSFADQRRSRIFA